MASALPDRTLQEVQTILLERGYVGWSVFGSAEGWIVNLRKGDGWTCGQTRPTISAAMAQVLGEEPPEDNSWMDLI